jgi:hypothetical protein
MFRLIGMKPVSDERIRGHANLRSDHAQSIA